MPVSTWLMRRQPHDKGLQPSDGQLRRQEMPEERHRCEFTLEDSTIYPGYSHQWWLYVPAQYDGRTPLALMVFQDGGRFVQRDGAVRVPVVLDNLISRNELPPMRGNDRTSSEKCFRRLGVSLTFAGAVPTLTSFAKARRSHFVCSCRTASMMSLVAPSEVSTGRKGIERCRPRWLRENTTNW